MPNQRENKVVVELTADEKQSISLLAAVQAHLALLKEYRGNKQLWNHHRSSEVVETLFRCEWLELDVYLDTVLVKGHLRPELMELALDTLKFCLIICWTLKMDLPERSFLDVLQRTVSSVRETSGQELQTQGAQLLEGVCDGTKDNVDRIVQLGRLISIVRDCYFLSLDSKIVEDKMELLVKDSVEDCEGRKFLYDGMLTKRTRKGKNLTYRV